MAGLEAGKVYNTWPLMNGYLVPPNLWNSEKGLKNFFENRTLVQFIHRNAGYLTAITTLILIS